MASPQLENGYIRIANELYERLFASQLGKTEFALMGLIVRLTYGMQRKSTRLPSSVASHYLGIDDRNARRAVSGMVEKGLLVCEQAPSGPNPGIYSINKNWEEWRTDRKSWPPLMDAKTLLELSPDATTYPGQNYPGKNYPGQIYPGQNYPDSRVKTTRLSGSKLPGYPGQNYPDSDRESSTSVEVAERLIKEDMKDNKTTPFPPPVEEGMEGEDCLDVDDLIDPEEIRRNEGRGSNDQTKLAFYLTLGQSKKLQSTCMQDLQNIEPVLVPRARDKLRTYLDTMPPRFWTDTGQHGPDGKYQRWAEHLRHWLLQGVAHVQERMREIAKMDIELRKKHRVGAPADMAIQVAVRICGENLAKLSVNE